MLVKIENLIFTIIGWGTIDSCASSLSAVMREVEVSAVLIVCCVMIIMSRCLLYQMLLAKRQVALK